MKIVNLIASRLLYSALAVTALATLSWLLKPIAHQAAIRPAH